MSGITRMNYFDEPVAATDDDEIGSWGEAETVDPVVDVLAELAGDGGALELRIGTGLRCRSQATLVRPLVADVPSPEPPMVAHVPGWAVSAAAALRRPDAMSQAPARIHQSMKRKAGKNASPAMPATPATAVGQRSHAGSVSAARTA